MIIIAILIEHFLEMCDHLEFPEIRDIIYGL